MWIRHVGGERCGKAAAVRCVVCRSFAGIKSMDLTLQERRVCDPCGNLIAEI